MKPRAKLPLVVSLLLVLGGWLFIGTPPIWDRADAPRARLIDLHSLDKLQTQFTADAGTARLFLILSPT